jgi:hypothetical protein
MIAPASETLGQSLPRAFASLFLCQNLLFADTHKGSSLTSIIASTNYLYREASLTTV